MQAVELAINNPKTDIVFTAVGFETTVPATAKAVETAHSKKLKNLSFMVSHRIVPPVLKALIADPDLNVSGFLLPGHVSAIIGESAYSLLNEYKIPGVITGFEPLDILSGILSIINMLNNNTDSFVKNLYTRIVKYQGNKLAQDLISKIYTVYDGALRGIGVVPECGLKLRKEYTDYDAEIKYNIDIESSRMPKGCSCGNVLKGVLKPNKCPLFGTDCKPEHPVGPCMVSSEGSCAAYYKYGE